MQLAANVKVAAIHGATPFSLFFARNFRGFEDFTGADISDVNDANTQKLLKRLGEMTTIVYPALRQEKEGDAQRKADKFAQTHKVAVQPFPLGSYVMTIDVTRGSKLEPIYEGPFRVSKIHRSTYTLVDNDGVTLPRNYAPSQLKLISLKDEHAVPATLQLSESPSTTVTTNTNTNTDIDVHSNNGNNFKVVRSTRPTSPSRPASRPTYNRQQSYVVEDILDDDIDDNTGDYIYLVKWKHYPTSEATWEPPDSFDGEAAIRRYWAKVDKSHGAKRSNKPTPTTTSTNSTNSVITKTGRFTRS